jgi:hypothetical protein
MMKAVSEWWIDDVTEVTKEVGETNSSDGNGM